MATEVEIARFLDGLTERWERFIVNDATQDDWSKSFTYCPISTLEKALQKWIENSPKMPSLFDIRSIALQMCGGSFYKQTESEEAAAYNDPETCKVVFWDEKYSRWLSQRVARRLLKPDGKGGYHYPLAPENHRVVFA